MRAPVLLALWMGLSSLICGPVAAQTPNERGSQSYLFTIEHKKQGFRADAQIRVEQTYLTERTLEDGAYIIYEYADSKVSKVAAWVSGRKLDKDRTLKFRPVIDDWFFNESRIWWLDFPNDVKAGDKIVYQYRMEYPDVTILPAVWMPNIDLTDKFTLQFEHPADLRVDFDFFFPTGRIDYRVERPSDKITTLTFDSIVGVKNLPYFEFDDIRAGILVRFYQGDSLINPVTVERYGDWYRSLLAGVPRDFPAVDSTFLDSLAAAATARDKARLIYDYVTQNLRYIHNAVKAHAFVPTAPAQVWRDKYGDCKDRAFLAKTLADSAGLAVRIVDCPARPGLGFDGISVDLINHVFCALVDGGDTLFFDPTARYTPFGSLPESDIGKNVVVIDSIGTRMAVVASPSAQPAVCLRIEGSLDSLSRMRARVVLKENEFAIALEGMKALPPAAFVRVLDSLVTSRLYKITLDSLRITSQAYDSLIVEGVADLSNFVVVSSKRRYLPRVPFTVIDTRIQSRRNDTLPLFFENRDALQVEIDLMSTNAVLTPDNLTLGSPETAVFSAAAATVDGNHVRLTYEFIRQSKILTGKSKEDFLIFCNDYLDAKKNMFILEGPPQ